MEAMRIHGSTHEAVLMKWEILQLSMTDTAGRFAPEGGMEAVEAGA